MKTILKKSVFFVLATLMMFGSFISQPANPVHAAPAAGMNGQHLTWITTLPISNVKVAGYNQNGKYTIWTLNGNFPKGYHRYMGGNWWVGRVDFLFTANKKDYKCYVDVPGKYFLGDNLDVYLTNYQPYGAHCVW